MPEYYLDTLDNGLRIVTVEMPHLHVAEMLCYVGVGSRHEDAGESGISHFLEHMLFRGTAEYGSSTELEQAFEALGGMVNASTDAESTCYHSRFHPDCLAGCAQLFASMLLRPLLGESEIEIERRIILEEALEDFNEQGAEVNPDNLTARLLWPGHALSQPTIGTRAALQGIDATRLRAHYRRHYTPGNCVVVVAGAVTRSQLVAAVTAAFGSWPAGAAPATVPFVAPPTEAPLPESVWVRDSDSQVSVQCAFRLPGRDDPRQMALRVLRRLLSGGGSSRLMLRLREELGLTYNIEANLSLYADSGCLTIDFAVTPESLVPAVEAVLEVLAEVRATPVGEEELQRVLRSYRYDLDFSLDHTDELAVRYGWGTLTGALRTLADDHRAVAAVTAAQLQQTARELLGAEQLKMAVVGPFRQSDQKRVVKALQAYGKESAAA